jgi:hypothetical protein
MGYSGNPAASDLDMVRFMIGDTDNSDLLVSDAEINGLLAANTITSTAVQCCLSLSAKYARKADKQVGDLRISYSQLSKQFAALADRIGRSPAAVSPSSPWSGGTYRDEKDGNATDTDIVQPFFSRNMEANPPVQTDPPAR